MSQPKRIDLLQTVGFQIRAGHLSDLLCKDQELFPAERAQIRGGGVASSAWQHLASTGTTVNGINQQCHILCKSLYTAYAPVLAKDGMTLLRVLQGGADPLVQMSALAVELLMSALAVELLRQLGVSAKWHGLLPVLLPLDQTDTESQLDLVRDRSLPHRETRCASG